MYFHLKAVKTQQIAGIQQKQYSADQKVKLVHVRIFLQELNYSSAQLRGNVFGVARKITELKPVWPGNPHGLPGPDGNC